MWARSWDESALPAKFRLTANHRAGRGLPDRFLRSTVEEAFAQWNQIPTSTFRAELAQQPVTDDRPGRNGVSEVAFTTDKQASGLGTASLFDGPAGISECDIRLHLPDLSSNEDAFRPGVVSLLVHELGHCLGLAHSEQYPISDWFPEAPSAFSPPPAMAYAWWWTTGLRLAEDDRVGASLLYPTPAFTRSRGAVGGRVMREEGPASFVYIQAFRAGTPPEAGPGSFTDDAGVDSCHLGGVSRGFRPAGSPCTGRPAGGDLLALARSCFRPALQREQRRAGSRPGRAAVRHPAGWGCPFRPPSAGGADLEVGVPVPARRAADGEAGAHASEPPPDPALRALPDAVLLDTGRPWRSVMVIPGVVLCIHCADKHGYGFKYHLNTG